MERSYCPLSYSPTVLLSHCLIVPPGSTSLYGVPLTNTLHHIDTYLFIPIHSIHNYTLHHFGTPYMCHQPKTRRWAYRNVYGLSIAFVVFYSAFIGLQNLQSSINSIQGLGLVTLSLVYGMFILSGFITPGFLKLFGTKYSLLFGCICHLIYNLSNYYPSWYTLVPASILIGFTADPIWAAANSHVAQVAITAAQSLGKKQDYLITKFTGIFFFFFQFS